MTGHDSDRLTMRASAGATVWNLADVRAGRHGQAASFAKWRFLDGA